VAKTERLDQILIRLRYATPAQIEAGVARQKERGGRFGTNLMELGFVTEEQLFDALVEQFRVPTISVSESSVPRELLDRMPASPVGRGLMLPVGWNAEMKVLSLAVANPSDEEGIDDVKRAFGAERVRISIAPESVLADLARRLGVVGSDEVRLVALPELFEPESAGREGPRPVDVQGMDRRILFVTRSAARKNFLPPVFKAEGIGLLAASSPEEIEEALRLGPVDEVLVDADMERELMEWVRDGTAPDPEAVITSLASVSRTLAETALPYDAMSRSLRGAVQAMAEFRCAQLGVSPPYGLMANDLDAIADRLRMRRVATDGLNVAMHLLIPVPDPGRSIDPFQAFGGTLELVARIRFPWPVDSVLRTAHGLFVGEMDVSDLEELDAEVSLAAQLLSLVWFRHNLFRSEAETDEEKAMAVRTALREFAGRLASLEIVESYLDELQDRGGVGSEPGERRVLLVGEERIGRALSPALSRVGCEVLVADEVAAAQSIVEGLAPSAIVMDHAIFGAEVELFGRVLKLDADLLLFVLTDSTDPAFVLNLLDIGVDDVFAPPHDFDVVAARVSRAIRARSRLFSAEQHNPGEFSAGFDAFSFLDLAQMLSNGMKTVRVDLTGGDAERAVLFLVNGRPVYAACGALMGPDAVYRVIAWDDRGEFTVSEDADVPEQNIHQSTESLLMEGVRQLDESRA
jgi:DNA-binding response OmpR family regulator